MQIQKINIGYRPHKYQITMHNKARLHRFSVIVAHRRFGKTIWAVADTVDRALRCPYPNGRYGYVAPYLKQAKDVAWGYFKQFTRNIPGVRINESDLIIYLPNGSRIRLYGADNADSMRGGFFDHVVIDEVADMKQMVWGEVIRPMLSDRNGSSAFIGTPKGTNLFSEIYFRALEMDDWYTSMYRADETDRIAPEELEAARREMSENQFRQEYLCDFTASADNILITIDMVHDAIQRKYVTADVSHAPVILGVDIARYGEDRSCIIRRQGLQAFNPIIMQSLDNMEVVGRVLAQCQLHKPDAIFIDAGRGEGVIDRLRSIGIKGDPEIIEVNFGGKPLDPHFQNMRSEMWYKMAQWVKDHGAIPNLVDLKNDLTVPTYSYANAANKFMLEPKEKIKERGLKSPDVGDALALTFAYPVAKSDPLSDNKTAELESDYDPLKL